MKNGSVIAVFTVLGFLVSLTILGNVEKQSKLRTAYVVYDRDPDCRIKIRVRACYDFDKSPVDEKNIDCSVVVYTSAGCIK